MFTEVDDFAELARPNPQLATLQEAAASMAARKSVADAIKQQQDAQNQAFNAVGGVETTGFLDAYETEILYFVGALVVLTVLGKLKAG